MADRCYEHRCRACKTCDLTPEEARQIAVDTEDDRRAEAGEER